jgi:3-hydroxybutyryl-CoA dehydratase
MPVYFEDFHAGQVTETPGRTITEADIVNFAGLTGDWYELHTNVEYARQTRFGQRIAHGALVFSISSALSVRTFPPGNTLIAFYGVDKLRFVRPVFIGDTIHVRETVVETASREDGAGIVCTQAEVLNQNDDVVVVYLARTLWRKRPA